MQSDERVAAALSALRPRVAAFRFAVSGALERARSTLASESGPGQARNTLGDFGGRLIDPERFAMISSGAGPLDAVARAAVGRAADVLEGLLCAGDEEFVVDVAAGASLAAAIRGRLTTLGSVFSAAALIQLVRRRMYDQMQCGSLLDGHPFERWSAAERKFAPPLVVCVDGGDLDPFALAPLIDGWVRLILLVGEPSTAAPLARLVSPGAFVAQSGDMKVLERIADFDGPAVIAVMNGQEARFVHDPRAGPTMWQRIDVTHIPDAQPRKALGVRSAWQQRDDLSHLKALIEQPALASNSTEAPVAAAAGSGINPAERLAAWLLEQSGLPADRGYAA
ncbi:MAG TPA: hypothetical protein VD771_00125 [Gemmatimonadaceae bacterium]|nr:hypothetical protein [Gemmatimonadaceae bacterium]